MEAAPHGVGSWGQEEVPRIVTPSPKKPSRVPTEGNLSHQGSSIHAEWCALQRTSGSSGSDHVQLSLGDPSPGGEPKRRTDSCRAKKKLFEDPTPEPVSNSGPPAACAQAVLTPGDAYVRLACWLALLFVGYGLQRGLCAGGVPYDCDSVDAADVYSTLTSLAFAGGVLGWLAGVTRPARFAWLAAPRRAYLWLLYLAVVPAYSGISTIPALHSSLTSFGQWNAATYAVIITVGVAALAAIAFHIWLALYPAPDMRLPGPTAIGTDAVLEGGSQQSTSMPDSPAGSSRSGSEAPIFASPAAKAITDASDGSAALGSVAIAPPARGALQKLRRQLFPVRLPRQRSWRALGLYLLPRGAVLLYFIVWFAALAGSGSFNLHLHHYALGWAVASLAAFNHPVSGMMLALGTAVFVQGASSYGFDPFFTPAGNSTGGCLNVTSPSTGQMTCAFWGEQQFNISFCSETNWLPWFDCTVDWPWPATKITKKMMRSGFLNFSVPDPLTPLVPLIAAG